LLGGHGFFDAGAHRYAGPGLAVPLQFADRVRVHCATSTGSPVSSTATKIVKHCNV